MVKKIIFDLDNTLIPISQDSYSKILNVFQYFHISYEDKFLEPIIEAMNNYEETHLRFDMTDMSRYVAQYTNIPLPDTFIKKWIEILNEDFSGSDSSLISLLEYLSSKYSLVISTNWYRFHQENKLKKYGIYSYFDEMITVEKYNKKPDTEMYDYFIEGYSKEEVVMVGDSFHKDIQGAINSGIHAYFITDSKDFTSNSDYTVISNIYELKQYL